MHSSAVEHGIADPGVTGSIPVAPLSRLAQLVERKTLNLVVVGSSPTVGASGAHGATAARRIPDPKVGGSNPSGLTFLFFSFFNSRNPWHGAQNTHNVPPFCVPLYASFLKFANTYLAGA